MATTMKERIHKAIDNLNMATNEKKYVLSQLTSTIKQLEDTSKILIDQVRTLTATNTRIRANRGHQPKQIGKKTTLSKYKAKIDPTGYCWTHLFEDIRVHTSLTCGNRNYGITYKANRADTT